MRPLRIMYIDDSDDDALLLSRALRHGALPTAFKWFPSADEAVGYLEHAGINERPDLIFCDLRMPGMDGHSFVRWLRGSKFHNVPVVVVLSSSDLLEDVRAAYQSGANSYLTKPLLVAEIWETVQNAVEFWSRCTLRHEAQWSNDPKSELGAW